MSAGYQGIDKPIKKENITFLNDQIGTVHEEDDRSLQQIPSVQRFDSIDEIEA